MDDVIIVLDENNQLWGKGDNNYGMFGFGPDHEHNPGIFVKLENFPPIKSFDYNTHIAAIDFDGNVWVCGLNEVGVGQLALLDKEDVSTPVMIKNIPHVKYVTCVNHITAFIDEEDNVWFCGSNIADRRYFYGWEQNEEVLESVIPTKIEGIPKIKFIRVEYTGIHMLDFNGNIWVLSDNFGFLQNKYQHHQVKLPGISGVKYFYIYQDDIFAGDILTIDINNTGKMTDMYQLTNEETHIAPKLNTINHPSKIITGVI